MSKQYAVHQETMDSSTRSSQRSRQRRCPASLRSLMSSEASEATRKPGDSRTTIVIKENSAEAQSSRIKRNETGVNQQSQVAKQFRKIQRIRVNSKTRCMPSEGCTTIVTRSRSYPNKKG
ncbi:unnamed protein product [Caenorhabditis nigoni]